MSSLAESQPSRPSSWSLALLRDAVADPAVVAAYTAKVRTVPGHDCAWWVGALSGAGHGRFFLGRRRSRSGRTLTASVIAHRFAFAVVHGVDDLLEVPVLSHGCDNAPCQRMGPGHVTASTPGANRAEWAIRRTLAGSPLGDPRGPLERSRAIRAQLLAGGDLYEVLAAGQAGGVQAPLW